MTTRTKRGRPTRLTARVSDRFFKALDMGYNRSDATRFAGIGPATFYRWMADERPEYREFREKVQCAEDARDDARGDASLRVTAVGNLFRLSRRNTKAALAWLAVSEPEVWGPAVVAVTRRPRLKQWPAPRPRGTR